MKILLVNVPWSKNGFFGVRAGSRWPHIKIKEEEEYMPYPFFMGYAYTLLEKNGFSVKLIDALADKILDDDFYSSSILFKPDLILIESSITSLENDLKHAKYLKEATKANIVLGGPLNYFYKNDFFEKNSFVDFVCIGEYELTLLELSTALSKKEKDFSKIKGLIQNKGSETNPTLTYNLIENLDSLPWPERKTLSMEHYIDAPGDMPLPCGQIIASRGCPYGCTFCMWPQAMYKRKFRVRSPKDVVDEMEYLVNELGFKSIYFDDDTFNIGKERLIEICDEIIKRKISVPWAIMGRADLMDHELLKKFKSAGLYAIKYGVETGDADLMKKISKELNLEKVISVVKQTKELGIRTHLTFTFGIPGETWITINKTIKLALELDPFSLQFSILTPFPETKLYDQLKAENNIIEEDFSKYDGNYGSVIQTNDLSKDDLENAILLAYAKWNIHKDRTYFDLKRVVSEKEDIIKSLVSKASFQDQTHDETYEKLQEHIKLVKDLNVERDNFAKKVDLLSTDKKELSLLLTDHAHQVKELSELIKLKEDKIQKVVKQNDNLSSDKKELSLELDKHVSLVKSLTSQIKDRENDIDSLKNDIASFTKAQENLSSELDNHVLLVKKLTSDLEVRDKKLAFLQKKSDDLSSDKKELSSELDKHTNLLKQLTLDLSSRDDNICSLKEKLDHAYQDKKMLSLELDKQVIIIKEFEKRISQLEVKNISYLKDLESKDKTIETITSISNNLKEQLTIVDKELKNHIVYLESEKQNSGDLRFNIDQLNKEISSLNARFAIIQKLYFSLLSIIKIPLLQGIVKKKLKQKYHSESKNI